MKIIANFRMHLSSLHWMTCREETWVRFITSAPLETHTSVNVSVIVVSCAVEGSLGSLLKTLGTCSPMLCFQQLPFRCSGKIINRASWWKLCNFHAQKFCFYLLWQVAKVHILAYASINSLPDLFPLPFLCGFPNCWKLTCRVFGTRPVFLAYVIL